MDDDTLMRYSRQVLLRDVGVEGQEKLAAASVLIVGVGGLGSPVAMYLASAGVGRLVIADPDEVELSNLPRQPLYREGDVGADKVGTARRALGEWNSATTVECLKERMDAERLAQYAKDVDVVADASDNFETRFAINRACHALKKPLVSAAVIRMEGQVCVFTYRDDEACYQCLYPPGGADEESCARSGILGPVAGVAGCLQATEAVKLICGAGRVLSGRMLVFDALDMEWREIGLRRDPRCKVCGGGD